MALNADNPIQRPEQDVLGRDNLAEHFTEHVLSLDAREGGVVGVLGPWGSGKTSFVNLAINHFTKNGITVLNFNPWIFSGTDHLLNIFFAELSAQLKAKDALLKVGKSIERYGDSLNFLTLIPHAGPIYSALYPVIKLVGNILRQNNSGIQHQKKIVEENLRKLSNPLVVIIDDIDRLTTSEIREIFKLIRLTANFQNIIYIAVFDRPRVEAALDEQNIPGRDYLEKILQICIDLPEISSEVLLNEFFSELDKAISSIKNIGELDRDVWASVFIEIIRPNITNIRDVRRYTATVFGTLRNFKNQIALADILGLEAIRIFNPNIFSKLHQSVDGLTETSDFGSMMYNDPKFKKQIDLLLKGLSDKDEKIATNMINILFPAAKQHISNTHHGKDWEPKWLLARRVAHRDILLLYLEKTIGNSLQSFFNAEQAIQSMSSIESFEKYIRSMPLKSILDLIPALENFETTYTLDQAVNGTISLLNIYPELPETEGGFFDFGKRLVVSRVVYRLIRSLKDPDKIKKALDDILPKVLHFSSKMMLITIVGYRENAGHKLITEDAASSLERQFRDEVRRASESVLSNEDNLLWILISVIDESSDDEPKIDISFTPEMMVSILKSARSEVKSQVLDQATINISHRLSWESLIRLLGDEQILKDKIEEAKGHYPGDHKNLFALADKYIAGWRPDRDSDD